MMFNVSDCVVKSDNSGEEGDNFYLESTANPNPLNRVEKPRCLNRRFSVIRLANNKTATSRTRSGTDVCLSRSFASSTSNSSVESSTTNSNIQGHVIALVGLPARGKTYISKKLCVYLNWIGIQTKVFNLGDYRRKKVSYGKTMKSSTEKCGDESSKSSEIDVVDHTVFSPDNVDACRLREQICQEAVEDAINYLRPSSDDFDGRGEGGGGEVAIIDATNTTRDRRKTLYNTIVKKHGLDLFFVESICDDDSLIESNIREVKVRSPDYSSLVGEMDEDSRSRFVIEDFKRRIQHYADKYETIDEILEPDLSFVKIFNAGRKVVINQHKGHIHSRIVYYLMNVTLTKRIIYLTRTAESVRDERQMMGGGNKTDKESIALTRRGEMFAQCLSEYVRRVVGREGESSDTIITESSCQHQQQPAPSSELKIWTSWMKEAINTTRCIENLTHERWKCLNDMFRGEFENISFEAFMREHEQEYEKRRLNKFGYRFPSGGESYEDLVARLEPVILELERQQNVMVVAHPAVIRCVLAYYMESGESEIPTLDIPFDTVIKLEPLAYGCKVEYIKFQIPHDVSSNHEEINKIVDDAIITTTT